MPTVNRSKKSDEKDTTIGGFNEKRQINYFYKNSIYIICGRDSDFIVYCI